MTVPTAKHPDRLYDVDETAWLDQTAALLTSGRLDDLDVEALAEYLTDMARRDRREVFSRLVVLLAHLLKWDHQPAKRRRSWIVTILEQQRELRQILQSATLRAHADAVLADAYVDARKLAAAETRLSRADFADSCPWSLDALLEDRDADAQ